MRCNRCGQNVADNISTCPNCGNALRKVVKNKFIHTNDAAQTGGVVSNKSLIKLQRVPSKKVEVDRKNFINYIDYKEAKEKNERDNPRFINIYSSGNEPNNTGASKGKNRYLNNSVITVSKEPVQGKYFNNISNVGRGKKRTKTFNFGYAFVFFIILGIGLFIIMNDSNGGSYYFGENKKPSDDGNNTVVIDDEMLQYTGVSKSGQTGIVTSNEETSIVYDYQYFEQLIFNSEEDVRRLVSSDSNKQKGNCMPSVMSIENEIINNYGIVAVNLCEMPVHMAEELIDVVAYIYANFPTAREYLTNLTIANVGANTYIAAFMPVFTFGTSKTSTGYPVAIKTQIILNAKYFLNIDKLNNSVEYGVKSGYFPRNANRSSAVAHEFGHYLSYVALLNHYNTNRLNFVRASQSDLLYRVYDDFNNGNYSLQILKDAYNRYQKMYGDDISFDDFRKSISTYAVARDKSGAYVYDETIAEAFHDVYLNGENAAIASRVIFSELKERI